MTADQRTHEARLREMLAIPEYRSALAEFGDAVAAGADALARVAALETAGRALVEKLDAVHADGKYQAVWQISALHVGCYNGPQYGEELDELRAALGVTQDTPGWRP
jgi:hypothetical protein